MAPCFSCKGKPEECEVSPGMCLYGSVCIGNQTTGTPDTIVCRDCSQKYNVYQKCGQEMVELAKGQ